MAKDDYFVISFKILAYLYAVLKGKEIFSKQKYDKAIGKKELNEEYLNRIYKMMSDDGLIEEVVFTKAWGNVYIPLFEENELQITSKGIQFLEENDSMKKAGNFLQDKADVICNVLIAAGLEYLIK